MTDIQQKIETAQDRIRQTVEQFGINRVYVAYSGGKDSLAALRLCRELYPSMLAVHNQHEGESVDSTIPGVLSIVSPKSESVPRFLLTVDLAAQIDGTRRDEDKTVIFKGEEIHRSRMSNWYSDPGVFGLFCCYPLWDWSEKDVYEYLEMTNPPFFTDVRVSYEGEGNLIGSKTLFAQYDPAINSGLGYTAKQIKDACQNVDALFVNANKLTQGLGAFVSSLSKETTIEVSAANWYDLKAENVKYFIVCDVIPEDQYPLYCSCFPTGNNIFIKVRVQEKKDFEARLGQANQWAAYGHQVLLMPEWLMCPPRSDLEAFGGMTMDVIDKVRPNVRIMPPMQHLIGIR